MAEAQKRGRPRKPPQKKPGLTAKQVKLLATFEETGSLRRACQIAKVGDRSHYDFLARSSEYREAFERSKRIALGKLEEEARRRAIEGVKRKKYFKGEPIIDPETGEHAVEYEYSDALLMFMLRSHMPEVYRERTSTEITGPAGQPLQIEHSLGAVNLSLLSLEELNALESLTAKACGQAAITGGDQAGASPAITGPVLNVDQAGHQVELASPTVVPDG